MSNHFVSVPTIYIVCLCGLQMWMTAIELTNLFHVYLAFVCENLIKLPTTKYLIGQQILYAH